MDNSEIIRRINAWQEAGFVHPLTCPKGSNHAYLIPIEKDGKVVLYCSTCRHIRVGIPEIVLQNSPETLQLQKDYLGKYKRPKPNKPLTDELQSN